MFRTFFNLWKKSSLLSEATQKTHEMMELASTIFLKSVRALLEQQEIKRENQEIYELDKKLNSYQIDVRRKVLEHLTLSPGQDITSSLIIITIVIDIERIGDYSKNLLEILVHYPEVLKGKYFDEIRNTIKTVEEEFPLTMEAFKEADEEKGKNVMEMHKDLARKCDEWIQKLIEDKRIKIREAIIAVLLFRYLKRVSAHLKNIASGVVNPFHRLGYKPKEN